MDKRHKLNEQSVMWGEITAFKLFKVDKIYSNAENKYGNTLF